MELNRYGMPNDKPYWIIDGYYYQINPDDLDNSIVMKIKGEELVSIIDKNEYDEALDRIRKRLYPY